VHGRRGAVRRRRGPVRAGPDGSDLRLRAGGRRPRRLPARQGPRRWCPPGRSSAS
jgi:hypothetical protein